MTEEQAEQLLQELSQMSEQLSYLAETVNNVQGYLKFMAQGNGGHSTHENLEALPANADGQYWNRLLESDGENGIQGGRIRPTDVRQLALPNTLTDEEKADIAARIAQAASKARLEQRRAARSRLKRRKRRG